MHYLGHFGNVKALRTFYELFDLALNTEDQSGQTIVHYATRNGYLGVLIYLQDFPLVDFGKLTKTGMSATIYAMIYQKVYTFVFLYFIKAQ